MIGIIFDIARIKDSLVYNTLTKEKVKGANVFFVAIDDDLFEELEISKDRKAFINSKKFREGVVRNYGTLFKESIDVSDNETENSFSSFWGYYQTISFLAENKIWQLDFVTSMGLTSALNHLSYLTDLNNEQERIMKEQQRNNR